MSKHSVTHLDEIPRRDVVVAGYATFTIGGEVDAPGALARSIELYPSFRDHAHEGSDCDSVRDDPAFAAVLEER